MIPVLGVLSSLFMLLFVGWKAILVGILLIAAGLEPYQIDFMFSGRGKRKVMWGTNGMGLARGKKELMEMDAKEDVKSKILRENAMNFLGLSSGANS